MSADTYLAARAHFVRTDATVTTLANKIAKIGETLKLNRSSFCFSNTPGGFPAEVVMGRQSITDDGNAWPTATAINAALVEWHQARRAMLEAFGSVPADQQAGLVAPPR